MTTRPNRFRPLSEIGRLERLPGTRRRIADTTRIKKVRQHGCLDREINVLGDIVDCCRYLDCIELADDNSDNVSALIEHRPAAVARLNRRRNLEIPGIVTQAGDRRNIADREISTRGEQPDQVTISTFEYVNSTPDEFSSKTFLRKSIAAQPERRSSR